jgi:arsenite methyltransferase
MPQNLPEPGDKQDIWSRWLLHRRDADDPEIKRFIMQKLRPTRDRVLDNAKLQESDTLLDVGCGDGLIAFGALERTSSGKVIFSDISQDLLDAAASIARDLGVTERCSFLKAAADDLSPLPDGSVSVVTTRSVLIYVANKIAAFEEFLRVLEPGGRLSIFEPINRFGYPSPTHIFAGYDVTPVIELAGKVREIYQRMQPDDDNPMLDFDERDLLHLAEGAGFREVHLQLEANIEPPDKIQNWEAYLRTAPNPLAPTLEEAIAASLTPAEAREFTTHLRSAVEQGIGSRKMACAYLWAVK